VEVKYTIDHAVHGGALQRALDQQKDLARALREKGMDVEVLPVIIGSMGTTRNDTRKHLQVLGIEPDEVQKLLVSSGGTHLSMQRRLRERTRNPPPSSHGRRRMLRSGRSVRGPLSGRLTESGSRRPVQSETAAGRCLRVRKGGRPHR